MAVVPYKVHVVVNDLSSSSSEDMLGIGLGARRLSGLSINHPPGPFDELELL
jgi:hypothetical protein